MAAAIEDSPEVIEGDIKAAEKKLANLVDMAAETGDRALLGKIREIEANVTKLREQKAEWAERSVLKQRLLAIDAKDIRHVLAANGLEVRDGGAGMLELLGYSKEQRMQPDQLRRLLTSVISRVELDPKTRELTVLYRLPVTGVKLASPRGFEPRYSP